MLQFTTGDILRAKVEALVNTVNCVGVMGRGIALQFKRAYPDNSRAYAAACQRKEVQPGQVLVVPTGRLTPPRWVINFPTKRHWRGKSRLEDIEAGLVALVAEVEERGIRSIAIPPLGCGLGGLSWTQVRPRIEAAFASVAPDIEVLVFEPGGGPTHAHAHRSGQTPRMTPGRAALVGLMDIYLRGSMDPEVSLLEVHKLMYFMQEAGEPLKLHFMKAHYGPYAQNLRHVLKAIEGHMVAGHADGGDDPTKVLELVPGAIRDANEMLRSKVDTQVRFERVARLVEGFETPFGLELLATVHWLLRADPGMNARVLIHAVHAWNERKRRFSGEQIGIAREHLAEHGWLQAPTPG